MLLNISFRKQNQFEHSKAWGKDNVADSRFQLLLICISFQHVIMQDKETNQIEKCAKQSLESSEFFIHGYPINFLK